MDVAVMYSGGKDSTYAIQHCLEQGWNIKYLLSIKPTRTDCYLFHFATVEHTIKQAEILGMKHHLISCDIADPKKEAELVMNKVLNLPKVDALVLGGTGLQETQLRSLQEAMMPHNVEVFAAHAGDDHIEVFKNMIQKGYKVLISQIASDGLKKWLGQTIDESNFNELQKDAEKFGFHGGFEGGYADSFITDCPIFDKKIELQDVEKVLESEYNGYIKTNKAFIVEKAIIKPQ